VAGLASGTAQGTLPWSWYSDPELLRHEQERIFRRGGQYAGPAEHAAGPGDSSQGSGNRATLECLYHALMCEALS
jgi:hypothetical protein